MKRLDEVWTEVAIAKAREQAKELLAALPPHPQIYWHGSNGKLCPCGACVSFAVARLRPEIEHAIETQAKPRGKGRTRANAL